MNDRKNEKKELRAVLFRIIIYVVVMSLFENMNADGAYENYRIIPAAVLLLFLFWDMIRTNKLSAYGFWNGAPLNYGKLLFLLPFVALGTVNLWRGMVLRYEPLTTILYMAAMLCIGFVEEILFRGYLLHVLQKQSVKMAIIVSSLTFGLGHIVNLLNGAKLLPTILQLIYACAIGFMLSVFVVTTGHILPCCLFHGVFNALSVFSNEVGYTTSYRIMVCIVITVISVGYAIYLWKKRV